MKTISSALQAHLQQPVTTLAKLWKISRLDGKVFGFAEHDQDIVYGGVTYQAQNSFSASAITSDNSLAVDNLEVVGFFDSAGILETELRAGLFDYARVDIYVVNWADISMGALQLRRGTIGEVMTTKQGIYRVELRGMTQILRQVIGDVYQPGCRVDVGSTQCGIPILPAVLPRSQAVAKQLALTGQIQAWRVADPTMAATDAAGYPISAIYHDKMFVCTTAGTTAAMAPTYDYTPGHTTTDGTAVFTCVEAWSRTATVASVSGNTALTLDWLYPDSRMSNANWFQYGMCAFEGGANPGAVREIQLSPAAGNPITLFLPPPFAPNVGDRVVVAAGCDHTIIGDCVNKFANAVNYRGEPYVPGVDQMFFYPNAG